jgi:protein TonB
LEEDIPIVNVNTPPPPPPPAVTESLQIIEDVAEIEETIIESTEINQDDAIEERIVNVDDVNVEEVEEDIVVPFAVIEKVPIFPGCKGATNAELKSCFQEKIQEHVLKNFEYPELAQELGIGGKVFVLFAIDKNGDITDIKSRGPDKILEKEAERIISLLPKMIPGKQRGKSVKVPYSIPIFFKYHESL